MYDFLSTVLTPEAGYVELRMIRNGEVGQEWYDLSKGQWAYEAASQCAQDYDRQGWDVYYGVLRRTRWGGAKTADVVDHAPVLWADVDPYKRPPNEFDMQLCADALADVLNFVIPPSIIVDSGHGIHAYWLLRDAAPVADASLAMKGIAKAIGGDHTHDPARVLRLPGTSNHKGGGSIPVRLLKLDTLRRYAFSDFAEYVDHGGMNGTPHVWTATGGNPVRITDLPEWLSGLIYNGASRGTRSEQCFKVVCHLIRRGWAYDDIRDLFLANPNGIGQKMSQRGHVQGLRWFDVTYRAAEAAA